FALNIQYGVYGGGLDVLHGPFQLYDSTILRFSVSGGHLNPAFTLTMCLLGQCPWWKLPIFSVVQTMGAFLGAGTVYMLYYDAIHSYSNGTLAVTGPRETASIFATYPAPYLSLGNGFFDQVGPAVLGTGVLILSILAIIDSRNRRVPHGLEPIAVGLLVTALGLAMGANCMCAINPARDLGPRLFTYLAGWGPQVFSRNGGLGVRSLEAKSPRVRKQGVTKSGV
uniref:Aquaporin 10 n=1 Tax=Podarcis muralis TaxID=64176 RepID=A0A670JL71_PODMU